MRADDGYYDELTRLNNELVNLQRQLAKQNAELEHLNQLKNQFLGMAAHDLRRPLGVITTYIEFVLYEADDALTAEHRGYLQTCLDAAMDMKRLIDAFLDVSIIESGKPIADLAPAPLSAILQGALVICRLMADRKGVELVVESTLGSHAAWVDGPKLQQVLVNLIANAIEHSQRGQRVWISARWDREELQFAVRDEGPGISPEDQARLFQPFARTAARKTAGERSTGLGLTIAQQVVEAHHGRIWVESPLGHGATFFVTLPTSLNL